jgi:hypothetical protein
MSTAKPSIDDRGRASRRLLIRAPLSKTPDESQPASSNITRADATDGGAFVRRATPITDAGDMGATAEPLHGSRSASHGRFRCSWIGSARQQVNHVLSAKTPVSVYVSCGFSVDERGGQRATQVRNAEDWCGGAGATGGLGPLGKFAAGERGIAANGGDSRCLGSSAGATLVTPHPQIAWLGPLEACTPRRRWRTCRGCGHALR